MKVLDKAYGFYAFLSEESDMIGNPIRYELEKGLAQDLSEKVSYDVGKIIDVLKSKVPFGQKWSNVVMLDTMKRSVIVQFNKRVSKFFPVGRLAELLPPDFFTEAEECAVAIRDEKRRYDDFITSRVLTTEKEFSESHSRPITKDEQDETRVESHSRPVTKDEQDETCVHFLQREEIK